MDKGMKAGETATDKIRELLVKELSIMLQVEESEIDTLKGFDEYGLDSMDAVVIVGLVEERLGRELEPELLLRYKCIDDVVNALRSENVTS